MSQSPEVLAYLEKNSNKSKELMETVYPGLLKWVELLDKESYQNLVFPLFVIGMIVDKMKILDEGFNLPYADLPVTTNFQDQFDQPHHARWDNRTATEYYGKIMQIIGAQTPFTAGVIFNFLGEKAMEEIEVKKATSSGTS